jgi:hypothetical protein
VWHERIGKARVVRVLGELTEIRALDAIEHQVPTRELRSWKLRGPGGGGRAAGRWGQIPGPSAPDLKPEGTKRRTDAQVARAVASTWYPVPRTLVMLTKEQGLIVEERGSGFSVRSRHPPQRELMRIRQDPEGSHAARPSVAVGAGSSPARRRAVADIERDMARLLESGGELRSRLKLVALLKSVDRLLAKTEAASSSPRANAPSREGGRSAQRRSDDAVGRWERRTWPGMIRFVQGGSPGLGKRS